MQGQGGQLYARFLTTHVNLLLNGKLLSKVLDKTGKLWYTTSRLLFQCRLWRYQNATRPEDRVISCQRHICDPKTAPALLRAYPDVGRMHH